MHFVCEHLSLVCQHLPLTRDFCVNVQTQALIVTAPLWARPWEFLHIWEYLSPSQ